MKIAEIIKAIEQFAPLSLQESWDNCGLQVGDTQQEVTSVLIALDLTEAVIDEAIEQGSNLIITHHPHIFKPIKTITTSKLNQRLLIKLIKNDISYYAAHTNIDSCENNISIRLAKKLNLNNIKILIKTDPNNDKIGFGAVGEMIESVDSLEYINQLKGIFNIPVIRHSKILDKKITKVAICGGSGGDFLDNAINEGADIYLTGDVKYNKFYDTENSIIIADIGHYESEIETKLILHDILSEKFSIFAIHLSKMDYCPVLYT